MSGRARLRDRQYKEGWSTNAENIAELDAIKERMDADRR
jgi:hypothetical protein